MRHVQQLPRLESRFRRNAQLGGTQPCNGQSPATKCCEAYCKANDYTVLAVYEEPEVAGGRADNRPQLQAALDQVCKEEATLVVYTLDRLARNVDDARAISKRLEKADANLAILQMRVDTTTPYGKLFFTIVAAFAEFYREGIAQRTSKAMLRHQACGRRMTRTDYCPYGKMPDWTGRCTKLRTIRARKCSGRRNSWIAPKSKR